MQGLVKKQWPQGTSADHQPTASYDGRYLTDIPGSPRDVLAELHCADGRATSTRNVVGTGEETAFRGIPPQ